MVSQNYEPTPEDAMLGRLVCKAGVLADRHGQQSPFAKNLGRLLDKGQAAGSGPLPSGFFQSLEALIIRGRK